MSSKTCQATAARSSVIAVAAQKRLAEVDPERAGDHARPPAMRTAGCGPAAPGATLGPAGPHIECIQRWSGLQLRLAATRELAHSPPEWPRSPTPRACRARARKKLAVRERLLAEARRLLLAQGVAGTGVAEIAEAADVAPATFFNHFASKDALLAALTARAFEPLAALVEASRAAHPADPAAQVASFFSGAAGALVVCAIAPWNFPVTLSMWKVAPALVAGNTMVLKPSPFTPLCTLKIGEIFRDVFPPGVLNIISGGDELGPLMTSHPGFAKISFTGSSATGKRVMESAAKDLKRVTLELGGNDAAIVLPDVNLDEVAQKIFFGAFFNTAQICVATKRLYVHEAVYDGLRDRLAAIAKAVKVGDGAEQGTVLGPIQNKRQYDRVMNLMRDTKKNNLTSCRRRYTNNGATLFRSPSSTIPRRTRASCRKKPLVPCCRC